MKDSDLNENKEDFDFDLDSTLDRLHEELKELSRDLEKNGDNELSNLSEKFL